MIVVSLVQFNVIVPYLSGHYSWYDIPPGVCGPGGELTRYI